MPRAVSMWHPRTGANRHDLRRDRLRWHRAMQHQRRRPHLVIWLRHAVSIRAARNARSGQTRGDKCSAAERLPRRAFLAAWTDL